MRPEDLHLTHHAFEQMAARRITLEEVSEALEEPETTYPSPHRDRPLDRSWHHQKRPPSEKLLSQGPSRTSLSPSPIETRKGSLRL